MKAIARFGQPCCCYYYYFLRCCQEWPHARAHTHNPVCERPQFKSQAAGGKRARSRLVTIEALLFRRSRAEAVSQFHDVVVSAQSYVLGGPQHTVRICIAVICILILLS